MENMQQISKIAFEAQTFHPPCYALLAKNRQVNYCSGRTSLLVQKCWARTDDCFQLECSDWVYWNSRFAVACSLNSMRKTYKTWQKHIQKYTICTQLKCGITATMSA